jgi:hypothetical protein
MKAGKLAIAAGLVLSLVFAPSAAAGTLDQQQTQAAPGGGPGFWATHSFAQTFKAGITGKLDQVDLSLSECSPGCDTTHPVTVEIRSATAAGPGSAALASGSIPSTSIPLMPAFLPLHFASPAAVTAGTLYAIVVTTADPINEHGWAALTGDPYPAGGAFSTTDPPQDPAATWTPGNFDFAFKTYVATPTGQRAAALKKCKKKHSQKKRKKCRKRERKLPV